MIAGPATQPRALAHVGITVADLEAACAWYTDVLGFQQAGETIEVRVAEGGLNAEITTQIFGERCTGFKVAFLMAANGAAVEFFEFAEPQYVAAANNFEYERAGVSHIAVLDPDIEGLCRRVSETGGRQRCAIFTLYEGQPYKICYLEDPFGTIIEAQTHSMAHIFSNQPQSGQP